MPAVPVTLPARPTPRCALPLAPPTDTTLLADPVTVPASPIAWPLPCLWLPLPTSLIPLRPITLFVSPAPPPMDRVVRPIEWLSRSTPTAELAALHRQLPRELVAGATWPDPPVPSNPCENPCVPASVPPPYPPATAALADNASAVPAMRM